MSRTSDFRLTIPASQDLQAIHDYIWQHSPDAADRVAQRLLDMMRDLARTPGMGHHRDDLADRMLRTQNVGPYLIIYQPDTQPIQIIRVLHGARDLGRELDA